MKLRIDNKKLLIIVLIISLILFLLITFSSSQNQSHFLTDKEITYLGIPKLKKLPEFSNDKLRIEGTGHPKATIQIYINDEFAESTHIDDNGSFSEVIVFTKDGETLIKIRQFYKNIESEFTEASTVSVDVTPPSPDSLNLQTKIPETTTKISITLTGSVSKGDILYINQAPFDTNPDGTFSFKYQLYEGNNKLAFSIADSYGNRTKIIIEKNVLLDITPPEISYYSTCPSNVGPEEKVSIRIGTWSGYLEAYNSLPIVGCVSGKLSSITVDGKKISWDNNGEVFSRIRVYVHGGLNRYKVIAIDKSGNKSTGYVETTATRNDDSIDINLYNY